MSKFATATFIIFMALFSCVTMNKLKNASTADVVEAEVCPVIEYRTDAVVNDLIKNLNSVAVEKRKALLVEELKKDTLLFKSNDVVRILSDVKFGADLREATKLINPYILQFTSAQFISTIKAQTKDDQNIPLEELKDTLADVSEKAKDEIVKGLGCGAAKIKEVLKEVKRRSCVSGKMGKNVVFLIDLSGSMNYYFTLNGVKNTRLKFLKPVIIAALKSFGEENYFKIVTFANSSRVWKEDFLPATAENKAAAIEWVTNIKAIGGTNTFAGIVNSFNANRSDFSLQLYTDGIPSIGEKSLDTILSWIKNTNADRVKKGDQAVKIYANILNLGGTESPAEKKSTVAFYNNLALLTSGTFKNFS